MKYHALLSLAVAAASALATGHTNSQQQALGDQDVLEQEQYLVETAPGETKYITEDGKWEMLRNGKKFMDISHTGHTYPQVLSADRLTVTYPSKTAHNSTVKSMAKKLKEKNMRKHLETFTSFHTRYYKSKTGIESATWLYGQVNDTITASGAAKHGATVSKFDHPWGQFSIIAQIPGKSNKTVVIGAHQDSINMFLPSILAAPGADDDGSGTVTILEALRVLLKSPDVIQGKAENTIEFHWYSAEEGGLLGSQAIFSHYSATNRDIKAMIQQDMTGYTAKTIAAGEAESVGVITDFVDPGLTEFIKVVITEYCDIPYVLTKCGYACSDHASASKYGYPSAFVIESDFKYSDSKIHTTEDKIEFLNFKHSKLTSILILEIEEGLRLTD